MAEEVSGPVAGVPIAPRRDGLVSALSLCDCLACPETRQPLCLLTGDDLAQVRGAQAPLRTRAGAALVPSLEAGLLREDRRVLYPVVDGIPRLIAGEGIALAEDVSPVDTTAGPYGEAYREVAIYDAFAASRSFEVQLRELFGPALLSPTAVRQEDRETFPAPLPLWAGENLAACTSWAQVQAYRFLSPLAGRCCIQVGGQGSHLIKLLLAGADEGVLLAPSPEELKAARQAAEHFGVGGRLLCVQAIAEQLPLLDGCVELFHASATMHHTDIRLSFPEVARVLKPGGRAALVEPLATPLYDLVRRLIGRPWCGCQAESHDYPLRQRDVLAAAQGFRALEVRSTGALFRYPVVAFQRLTSIRLPLRLSYLLLRADAYLGRLVPPLRRLHSLAAICLTR